MFKLNPNEREKMWPLFTHHIPHHLAVESILTGLSPAVIYLDDVTELTTAVIHHLRKAIAAGFDDWERLHNSPNLAPVRNTATWQTFINTLEQDPKS